MSAARNMIGIISSTDAPPAPYPADTRAKGWRFEIDYERIEQSDTWVLATPDMRPWLLMLWMTAWRQSPCGSMPAQDELITARIGMDLRQFRGHRDILMRGWWLAADGRMYHSTITEQVLRLLEMRDREASRKQAYRDKKNQRLTGECPTGQPRDSRGIPLSATLPEPEPEPEPKYKRNTEAAPLAISSPAAPSPDRVKKASEMTPDEIIFGYGVPILVQSGTVEKQARSFLGKLRKQHGDAKVIDALRQCLRTKPLQPLEWLAKMLPPSVPKQTEEQAERSKRDALIAGMKAALGGMDDVIEGEAT